MSSRALLLPSEDSWTLRSRTEKQRSKLHRVEICFLTSYDQCSAFKSYNRPHANAIGHEIEGAEAAHTRACLSDLSGWPTQESSATVAAACEGSARSSTGDHSPPPSSMMEEAVLGSGCLAAVRFKVSSARQLGDFGLAISRVGLALQKLIVSSRAFRREHSSLQVSRLPLQQ